MTGKFFFYKVRLVPAKNITKIFVSNSFYHLYNRGANKQQIFLDDNDYTVFLSFLKRYLTKSKNKPLHLFDQVQLIAYCLMPNHFHLLLKQKNKQSITNFMRAVSNSYVQYFNKKYHRTGPLFENTYKAILLEDENYLLYLTKYIHLNPLAITDDESQKSKNLVQYPYSSYANYLGEKETSWVYTEDILSFFNGRQQSPKNTFFDYQNFVEGGQELEELIIKVKID